MSIARKFFKYYTTEDEYGKDAYKGCEQEFWDYRMHIYNNLKI